MNLSDFDYVLPERYIAQFPIEPRDAARMMVVDRATGTVRHSIFADLGRYVQAGDALIFNNTRVIPARLFSKKAHTGGHVEVLLLKRAGPVTWEVLLGGKNLRMNTVLDIDGVPNLQALITQRFGDGRYMVQFSQQITPLLEQIGQVPLPPYIHEPLAEVSRYQTVYAQTPGSAAAPTAGLHFTPDLLAQLQTQGVQCGYVTLHVGLDTFKPVAEDEVDTHVMHGEWCEVPGETAELINATKRAGKRVIAVGTSTARTLEAAALQTPEATDLAAFSGSTQLFIRPGHAFRVIDGLITNFHLPKSTLLMLVAAFMGRERMLAAYEAAKRAGYRFYSFGDCQLIV